MKKIIFIISITLLAFNSQAQGTLQFNQVLTFATDTSFIVTDYNKNDLRTWDIYTVPNNRVVKITKAINVQNGGGSYCSVNSLYYTINGINTTVPLLEDAWLKEGDVIGAQALFAITYYTGGCDQENDMFISLIEYNIIPE
tara:strand:- start:164 stop:586 length:423 start_codon:yes stop_codon:yes gene_type:complete